MLLGSCWYGQIACKYVYCHSLIGWTHSDVLAYIAQSETSSKSKPVLVLIHEFFGLSKSNVTRLMDYHKTWIVLWCVLIPSMANHPPLFQNAFGWHWRLHKQEWTMTCTVWLSIYQVKKCIKLDKLAVMGFCYATKVYCCKCYNATDHQNSM
jgi:hypothetical protein